MSDYVFFSSYVLREPQGVANGQDSWGFFMHRALDGWMLANAPASPAQDLHHHGPRYFNSVSLLLDSVWP